MARKRKSRNNKISDMGQSVALVDRIILLSRAAIATHKILNVGANGRCRFFVLKGCGDSGDVDNDGDGTFYATVQDCIDDGNNSDICAHGWNNAKAAFYADVPKNMTQQNCQSKYENCYYDNVEQSWIPVVSGFC